MCVNDSAKGKPGSIYKKGIPSSARLWGVHYSDDYTIFQISCNATESVLPCNQICRILEIEAAKQISFLKIFNKNELLLVKMSELELEN